MRLTWAVAPSLQEMRPYRSPAAEKQRGFPIYDDLGDRLVYPDKYAHNDVRPRLMATCSAYSYSDAETLSMIMARMGLEGNRCLAISQSVDAMAIDSTAFLVQSGDGRVLILSYRGTEPADVIDWLAITDVTPDKIQLKLDGQVVDVHAGFYRNVRATRYKVLNALKDAEDETDEGKGKSILTAAYSYGKNEGPVESNDKWEPASIEALYITGHSLGGAMAALMAVTLCQEREFETLVGKIKGVYTFGQPMIGSPDFAEKSSDILGSKELQVNRYVFRNDFVPQLPPVESGTFEHFGNVYQYNDTTQNGLVWPPASKPTVQTSLLGIGGAFVEFFSDKTAYFRGLPFPASLVDHYPQCYISGLTPLNSPTEYGDISVAVMSDIRSTRRWPDVGKFFNKAEAAAGRVVDKITDRAISRIQNRVLEVPGDFLLAGAKTAWEALSTPWDILYGSASAAVHAINSSEDLWNVAVDAAGGAINGLASSVTSILEEAENIPVVGDILRWFDK